MDLQSILEERLSVCRADLIIKMTEFVNRCHADVETWDHSSFESIKGSIDEIETLMSQLQLQAPSSDYLIM